MSCHVRASGGESRSFAWMRSTLAITLAWSMIIEIGGYFVTVAPSPVAHG